MLHSSARCRRRNATEILELVHGRPDQRRSAESTTAPQPAPTTPTPELAPQQHVQFRFDLLPEELQGLVVESLGSEYFRRDIRRLTLSRSWYFSALRTTYRDMAISRNPYALPPLLEVALRTDLQDKARDQLERHLRVVRVDVDEMFRRHWLLPEDGDLERKDRTAVWLERRRKDSRAAGDKVWLGPGMQGPPEHPLGVINMALNLPSYVFSSSRAHTLDFQIKEPWGLDGFVVAAAESVLFEVVKWKKLRHLRLDLAGLARRGAADLLLEPAVQAGDDDNDDDSAESTTPTEPPPERPMFETYPGGGGEEEELREEKAHAGQFAQHHVCSAISQAMPNLETLHLRPRCICPEIFQHHGAEDEDEDAAAAAAALPHLKEVIINMVMPRDDTTRHRRLPVLCTASDEKLDDEARERAAGKAVEELKKAVRGGFLKRLGRPRRVALRYERRSKEGRVVVEEWDALTGKVRRRRVDRWGEVVR